MLLCMLHRFTETTEMPGSAGWRPQTVRPHYHIQNGSKTWHG